MREVPACEALRLRGNASALGAWVTHKGAPAVAAPSWMRAATRRQIRRTPASGVRPRRPVRFEVLDAYRAEGVKQVTTARAVGLVERALRGDLPMVPLIWASSPKAYGS